MNKSSVLIYVATCPLVNTPTWRKGGIIAQYVGDAVVAIFGRDVEAAARQQIQFARQVDDGFPGIERDRGLLMCFMRGDFHAVDIEPSMVEYVKQRAARDGLKNVVAVQAGADRTNLPDLRSFVSAMVQADAFGIPVGQVLRVREHAHRVTESARPLQRQRQILVPCPGAPESS